MNELWHSYDISKRTVKQYHGNGDIRSLGFFFFFLLLFLLVRYMHGLHRLWYWKCADYGPICGTSRRHRANVYLDKQENCFKWVELEKQAKNHQNKVQTYHSEGETALAEGCFYKSTRLEATLIQNLLNIKKQTKAVTKSGIQFWLRVCVAGPQGDCLNGSNSAPSHVCHSPHDIWLSRVGLGHVICIGQEDDSEQCLNSRAASALSPATGNPQLLPAAGRMLRPSQEDRGHTDQRQGPPVASTEAI